MKITNCFLVILTVGALALAGCGKSGKSTSPARTPGRVDITELQQAFQAPPPEVTTSLDKLRFALRYSDFDVALTELNKLAHLKGLKDAQKKAIDEVIQQVNVAITKAPPRPPPA